MLTNPVEGIAERNAISSDFAIYQNWPNPFNMATTLSFYFPRDQVGEIVIYDVLGRRVGMLPKQEYPAGQNRVAFDGAGLASGAYFAVLNAGGAVRTCRMTLVK